MVLWSHSKLPTVPLPRILFLDSFFGSMPMISMEMETQIPSETEAQFLLGSTNQPRGVTVNQTNFGSKPIYKSASFGSKPAVRFDGIDDVLNLTPIRSSAGGYSVYVATRRHDTLGDDNAHIIDEATWNLVASNSNQPYGTKIVAQSGASGATLTNLKIGKDAGGTNNDFGGDIGEILIFERQLSSTEEAKVVDHLVHKWGASPVAIFSPTSIPNLQLWLDASDTSSISKNSSNQVSQWNDKSGNGRNVSQSGANNIKPTFPLIR